MIYYRELEWTGDTWGGQEVVSREELIELVTRHHETDRVRGGSVFALNGDLKAELMHRWVWRNWLKQSFVRGSSKGVARDRLS
jgi:hypothetical protein